MKINAIEAGTWGMMTAQESSSRHAEQVSRSASEGEDMVTPIVGMMTDSIQFKASAKVVSVGEAMQKAALDILA